jgi:hypothetical protein
MPSRRLLKNYFGMADCAQQSTGWNNRRMPSRMVKMAVQRGRSERRGEAYSSPYVEPLSDARTKLADFFNILLGMYETL